MQRYVLSLTVTLPVRKKIKWLQQTNFCAQIHKNKKFIKYGLFRSDPIKIRGYTVIRIYKFRVQEGLFCTTMSYTCTHRLISYLSKFVLSTFLTACVCVKIFLMFLTDKSFHFPCPCSQRQGHDKFVHTSLFCLSVHHHLKTQYFIII